MTINELIASYRQTPEYGRLADSSKISYENSLQRIASSWGLLPVKSVGKKKISDVRMLMKHHPGAMNRMVSVLSILFNHAIMLGEVSENQCTGVIKVGSKGIPSWTTRQVDEAKIELTSGARRSFFLLLYTGQRMSDVSKMRFSDIEEHGERLFIKVKQDKTGAELLVPMHPELIREVFSSIKDVAMVGGGEHLVNCKLGQTIASVRGQLRRQINNCTLGCPSPHGLRKNAAIMFAEAGCSEREIMAITGHRTPAMVSKYVKGVNQMKLASSAMDKLEALHGQGH